MNEAVAVNETDMTAKIIYVLYLAGIVVGITGIIGVVMAYVNRGDAPEWLKSHYTFQIRTFWMGFLFMFVGALTMVLLVGYLILLFWLVWLVVRCVKGLQMLDRKQPMPNVNSWMFG
jgi:uncharacterized membrane protein